MKVLTLLRPRSSWRSLNFIWNSLANWNRIKFWMWLKVKLSPRVVATQLKTVCKYVKNTSIWRQYSSWIKNLTNISIASLKVSTTFKKRLIIRNFSLKFSTAARTAYLLISRCQNPKRLNLKAEELLLPRLPNKISYTLISNRYLAFYQKVV